MPKKVFISGASGFVGRAIVRRLLACDYHVHALIHRRPLGISDERIKVFPGAADDHDVLHDAISGVDAVIHLVGIIAENPRADITFHRLHVDFTRAIVEGCLGNNVWRFIHMSALGARSDAPALYHQTKAAAEAIVTASPLLWTIFRPSLIHGPEGEFTRMLFNWVNHRQAPWLAMPYFAAGVWGLRGSCRVQPVFVDDVARAFVDAVNMPQTIGHRYDLAGRQLLTWPEMYRHFARAVAGKTRPTLPVPAWYALLLTRLLPPSLLPFNRDQVLMSQEDSVADMNFFAQTFSFLPAGFDESLKTYAPKLPFVSWRH